MDPQTLNTANRAITFLGWFSLGLGTLEAMAPGVLGRTLGLEDRRVLLRLYGLRELSAGAGLLAYTKTPLLLWARVAGDALDILTLAPALRSGNARRRNAGVALASVPAITGLDIWTALQITRHEAGSIHPHALRVR